MPAILLNIVIILSSDPRARSSIVVTSPGLYLGARKTASPTLQKTPSSLMHFGAESSGDPKQGSDPSEAPGRKESLKVPSLPLQTRTVATANQELQSQHRNSVLHNKPQQTNNTDPTESESSRLDQQQPLPLLRPPQMRNSHHMPVSNQDSKSGVCHIDRNKRAASPARSLNQSISRHLSIDIASRYYLDDSGEHHLLPFFHQLSDLRRLQSVLVIVGTSTV